MNEQFNFDKLRHLTIGTVDFVSPNEIKVLLETDAPQNTALNTGVPSLFPRINGFVLVPNEVGALVGIISWLGVEHSQYPKRKGFKDYDLIDLPFPLRKMAINPIGTLKRDTKNGDPVYTLERGVYSFPSIGDSVILPTDHQLKSIVENDDENACVKIGVAPIAGNANVKINPDKLFGRHVAVLGNTGSGKSCSVAGLIRWSLEEAEKNKKEGLEKLNSRFVILDPNGEYSNAFKDLNSDLKLFKVEITEDEAKVFKQLKVPAWFWNSYEWSSFSQATGRTQRPILRRALRELKSGAAAQDDILIRIRRHFSSCVVSITNDRNIGAAAFRDKGKTEFGKKLQGFANDATYFVGKKDGDINTNLGTLAQKLNQISAIRLKSFEKNGETITYFDGFEVAEVDSALTALNTFLDTIGGITSYEGPDEDMPISFDTDQLPEHLELIAQEQGALQFLDFFIMRIRTMLSDTRMKTIIGNDKTVTLESWLKEYLSGIVVIDLSLVPADIVHLIVAVVSRIVFEAIQRYRRKYAKVLPTVLVLEEAHNFIKKYNESEDISAAEICSQVFERVAKEGRKFGVSLMLSSQRPSELSATILSQCNTFLLHRIVNDRDQDLVRRLVPDNIGGLLQELPILPTRKAILLGWASPLPILVEMRELAKKYRPKSDDPDFWDVWTGQSERKEEWKVIADEWQEIQEKTNAVHESVNGATTKKSGDNDDLPF
jgi:uncharacterized protein